MVGIFLLFLFISCSWAISYLCDGDNERIQGVVDAVCLLLYILLLMHQGVCRRLVELLSHRSPTVITPALRAVGLCSSFILSVHFQGNIATGNDVQTQTILNSGVLPPLCVLLGHAKRSIRKETAWTFSNITAGVSACEVL